MNTTRTDLLGIEEIEMDVATYNNLKAAGINTIAQLHRLGWLIGPRSLKKLKPILKQIEKDFYREN